MSDNRPVAYFENGVLIIRASGLGSDCMLEFVAAAQGWEPQHPPQFLQRAFDRGTELEPQIVEMLEERGWEIWGSQDEGHLNVSTAVKVRFHPDGIGRWNNTDYVVEIKALSDALWSKAARYGVQSTISEYAWQLSVMMHSYQLPGMWVAFNKGNSNGDPCEDQGRLYFQRVLEPLIPLGQIEDKALTIFEKANEENALELECGDPSQFPCRFLYMRREPEDTGPNVAPAPNLGGKDMADLTQDEVDYLLRTYVFNKGQVDEADERRKEARDAILKAFPEDGPIQTNKFKATITSRQPDVIDWENVPQYLKDQLNRYKKPGSKSRYITNVKGLE